MACRLCLEKADDVLAIESDEGIQSNVAAILDKYFQFCFAGESNRGVVCRKCWWEVKMFHDFYSRIEAVHCVTQGNESIFVRNVTEHLKIDLVTKEENTEFKRCTDEDCQTAEYLRDRFYSTSPEPRLQPVSLVRSEEKPIEKKSRRKKKGVNDVSETNEEVRPKKTSYKTNYKSRGKNTSKIFNCDTCGLTFLSEYKLYCHSKETHQLMPFKCIEAKCVESYATQEQLDQHTKQNHSRVNCPHCNKMIKLYYLPLHIKFYHDKDQRIICDLCGNVSNNINTHKSHHRLVHDIQPRLQCDICKDWSRNKNSLREHMRVRHIQVPEVCSICGKMSANKKALMKHKKFHFAEAREKFKCNVCGRGFRDSTKLKEHSYIHSGISDVYRCSYCEKSFRFASSMYAHRKKAHPNEEQYRSNEVTSKHMDS